MSKSKIETRTFATSLRASQGDEMAISGRALSYNTLSQDLGGFREQLLPGCFSRHLSSNPDVLCRREHQTGFLLGRTSNGSLRLNDGPDGLSFNCKIDPSDPIAVSTHAAIRSGLISGMSFAFTVDGADGQSWNTSNEDACPNRRTIRRATLVDVSPVASPAYDKGTSVNARRLDYGAIVSDQSAIHAQIAVWNQRKKNLFIEARAIAALFPGIALEDVALYSRIYKGTELQDRLYQLRAWDLGKEMWQGGAFGVQCGEGLGATHREGQTSDPQMTLRDCTEADSKLSHRQAAKFHRTAAQKASDFSDGAKHYVAGDAHAEAARMYPDKDASERARAASRGLR